MAATPRPYLWKEAELINSTASETGATIHFYDTYAEMFYPNNGLKYKYGKVPEGHWEDLVLSDEATLEATNYVFLKGDHPATGSLYLIGLDRGTKDTLYLFRYDYERDVSELVETIMMSAQSDNPIAQIAATVKNVKDTLYTKESSLFVPSSKITLGVAYGRSMIATLMTGYIDQIDWRFARPTVSISGRNTVGYFLNSQTFDVDKHFKGNAVAILTEIFDLFGVTDYEIDPSESKTIEFDVKASDTGMKAVQSVSDLLSDIIHEKLWDIEEMYDGKIVAGYAEFRGTYIPKGKYIFHGKNDVFENNMARSIDGSFTHVRVTGTKKDGYDLTPVYKEVQTWRFWTPGDHRTYHAPQMRGITQDELEAYANLLVKQLKEGGQTTKYKSTLRPQLVIGDVAYIASQDTEEEDKRLGIVTEIKHNLGVNGFMTEFTAASGGEIREVGNSVYTSSKGVQGSNRTRKVSDFIATPEEVIGGEVSKGDGPTPQPSMEQFEYAHFDGSGYITLPWTTADITRDVRIEVSFELDGYEEDMAVFGNTSGLSFAHLSTGYAASGQWLTSDGSSAYSFSAPFNGAHVYILNISNYGEDAGHSKFSTNGTYETIHTSFSPTTAEQNLLLGFRAGATNKFAGRLKYFRIYDLNEHSDIACLVAAAERDSNGAIINQGLYDQVTKQWFTCEGMTVFKKYTTKYAYAHFSGGANGWFNIDNVGPGSPSYLRPGVRIFCAFKCDSFLANMAIWGNSRNSDLAHLFTGSSDGEWHTSQGYAATTFTTSVGVTNRQFSYSLNDDFHNIMYYDGQQYIVTEYTPVTESCQIRVGGAQGAGWNFRGDISKFQIYDTEASKFLIDMYPAASYSADGTLLQTGMYDRINDRWYTCNGMEVHN